jgi:hypothetical protein
MAMATPSRLVQLMCPRCSTLHWEIDNDFRGTSLFGGRELAYEERPYTCPGCKETGTGYRVQQKGPPEFFLQPHDLYPMPLTEFLSWLAVCWNNFPDVPVLDRLGLSWYPGKSRDRTRDLAYRLLHQDASYWISVQMHPPHDPQMPIVVRKKRPAEGEAIFALAPEVSFVRVSYGFDDPELDAQNFPPAEVAAIAALLRTHEAELRRAWLEHDRALTVFQRDRLAELTQAGAPVGFPEELWQRMTQPPEA